MASYGKFQNIFNHASRFFVRNGVKEIGGFGHFLFNGLIKTHVSNHDFWKHELIVDN